MSVQNIADNATAILEEIVKVADDHNKTVDQFNEAVDEIERLRAQVEDMQNVINEKNRLLDKQSMVIDKAVEHKGIDKAEITRLKAELKHLQQLDPKRLFKVNKTQKATIADLKATIKDLEEKSKDSMRKATEIARKAKEEGQAPFYVDPVTGNSIRAIPRMYVAKGNEYGGMPDTPVLEFHHRDRGITRQGTLLQNGKVAWAAAQNSAPTESDAQIAKDYILTDAKRRGVKVKFTKEPEAA